MKTLIVFAGVATLSFLAWGDEIDLRSHAKDLVLTLRPHTNRPTFGDHLILEITLINRGTETIRAPGFGIGLIEFRAKDPESGLELEFPGMGFPYGMLAREIQTVSYAPNQPVTILEGLGLPGNARDFEHPFWSRLNGIRQLDIFCVFHVTLGQGIKIYSAKESIRIDPRPEAELAALNRYAVSVKGVGDTAFRPSSFGGIGLDGLRNRREVSELANEIKSAELRGIIELTLLMQQLKHDTVDREAVSQKVLDWVIAQPDIKRQWMARQVSGHQLLLSRPVLDKLRAIAYEPRPPIEP